MKIYNIHSGETIAEIMTNHSMSLDDALCLATEAEPYLDADNNMVYVINGEEVYYDDVDIMA